MPHHFLVNAGKRVATSKRKKTVRAKSRRRRARAKVSTKRRRRTRRTTLSKGGTVAKRRRRRRAVSSSAPRRRRRRRRNPGALARARSNPGRRRRRRVSRRRVSARRRRGVRRNPGLPTRGIVGSIVQGLKDGGAVVAGEVAARKVRGAVTGMLPANVQAQVASGAGKIALSIASSLAVSLVARRVLPGMARMVTAGAFAESINCVLATTPIAPFLAAYPRRLNGGGAGRMGAWTGATLSAPVARRVGVGAYPGMRSVGVMSTG